MQIEKFALLNKICWIYLKLFKIRGSGCYDINVTIIQSLKIIFPNLPNSNSRTFSGFLVLRKKDRFAIMLLIWSCLSDAPSSYFFCVSKVSSLLHHGLVGQNQNKIKNALVHSQVILLQVLLFFIIKFIFLSWCTL